MARDALTGGFIVDCRANRTFLSTLLQAGQRNGPRIVPGRIRSGWIMAHPVGVAERADSVDEPTGRVDPGDIGVPVP